MDHQAAVSLTAFPIPAVLDEPELVGQPKCVSCHQHPDCIYALIRTSAGLYSLLFGHTGPDMPDVFGSFVSLEEGGALRRDPRSSARQR